MSASYVSHGRSCGSLGNGPSQRPAISEGGTTLFYDSDASNFRCYSRDYKLDQNGHVDDVFFWTESHAGSILFTWDTNYKALRMDSRNPATSARTNYYL